MEFFINFLWYLLAFVVGAIITWLVLRSKIKARTADEAFADLAQEGVR